MLGEQPPERRAQSQPPVVIPRLKLPKTRTDKEEREDKLKGNSYPLYSFPIAHQKMVQERYQKKQRAKSKQDGPGASRGRKFPDRMRSLMKADDEYRRLLKVMDRDPDFDNEEIEMF